MKNKGFRVRALTEFKYRAEVALDRAEELSARADMLMKEIGNTEPVCSDEPDAASPQKSEKDGLTSET